MTGSTMLGVVMAQSSVSVQTAAKTGALFAAAGAVTLINNDVSSYNNQVAL